MNPLKVMDAKLDHTFLYVIGHKANDYPKHSYCKRLYSSVVRQSYEIDLCEAVSAWKTSEIFQFLRFGPENHLISDCPGHLSGKS